MSAARVCAARSRVPVWHRVTVAFSLRRVSSRPERPADGVAPADHGDLGAAQRHVVAAEQLDDAARGARQRAVVAEDEPAQVTGCSPSASLSGSISSSARWVSSWSRQRQLDDVAVCRPGRRSARPPPRRPAPGWRGRQIPADRGDAHLGAVPVLAVDVRLRARIVTDQDRAQPGRMTRVGQRLDPYPQLVLDRRRVALPSRIVAVTARSSHGHRYRSRLPAALRPLAPRPPAASPSPWPSPPRPSPPSSPSPLATPLAPLRPRPSPLAASPPPWPSPPRRLVDVLARTPYSTRMVSKLPEQTHQRPVRPHRIGTVAPADRPGPGWRPPAA